MCAMMLVLSQVPLFPKVAYNRLPAKDDAPSIIHIDRGIAQNLPYHRLRVYMCVCEFSRHCESRDAGDDCVRDVAKGYFDNNMGICHFFRTWPHRRVAVTRFSWPFFFCCARARERENFYHGSFFFFLFFFASCAGFLYRFLWNFFSLLGCMIVRRKADYVWCRIERVARVLISWR